MVFRAVLEKITHRLVKAPMHRVVSPKSGTRYSVGFFQGVAADTRVADAKFECAYLNYLAPGRDSLNNLSSPAGDSRHEARARGAGGR
jgi:isopenicillin N synthase-like dioxygenase